MTDCVWQNISIEIPDKPENTFRFGGGRAAHDLSTAGNIFKILSLLSSRSSLRVLLKVTTIADQFRVKIFQKTKQIILKTFKKSVFLSNYLPLNWIFQFDSQMSILRTNVYIERRLSEKIFWSKILAEYQKVTTFRSRRISDLCFSPWTNRIKSYFCFSG